jgi:hypothetical protein
MRRPIADLTRRPAPPLEPSASVPEQLARVPGRTRVRVFHGEGGEKRATSGRVVAHEGGGLTVAPLDGGAPLRIPTCAITCMYLP